METEDYRIVIVQIRNIISEKQKENQLLTNAEKNICAIADSIIHTKIILDADDKLEKAETILRWRYMRKIIKTISENVFFIKSEVVCQTSKKCRKGDFILARRIIAKILTQDLNLITDVQMGIQLGHLDASSINCGVRRINELIEVDSKIKDTYLRCKSEIEKIGTFADFVKINTFA